MNNRKIKLSALLLSLLMGASVLAACSTNNNGNDATDKTTEGTSSEVASSEEGEEEETPVKEYSAFEAHDLGGATIKVLSYNSLDAQNPDAKDLEDYEKAEREAKINYIEDKYNVKLEFTALPDVEYYEIPNEMVKAHVAGDPIADIFDVSYGHFFATLASNNILEEATSWISNVSKPENSILGDWVGKNYGIGTTVGGEGLLYNREMIKQAGMEKEPNELFATGHWSYDDFVEYVRELNSKLPEGTSAFFIDPYYWFLFAPAANGTELVSLKDQKINYQDPNVIEALEVLSTLKQGGLVMDPNLTEDGQPDAWTTPQVTFDEGVGLAMTHRAAWQASGLAGKIDFGFVPYPWGSNVTVGTPDQSDSYKTLSDNYAVTVFDGQGKYMSDAVSDKADPEGVFTMFMDLIDHDFISPNYKEEATDDIPLRWFNTELDAELYEWSTKQERMEFYSPFRAAKFELAREYVGAIYDGGSVRSVIDAAAPADQAKLNALFSGELTEVNITEEEAEDSENSEETTEEE